MPPVFYYDVVERRVDRQEGRKDPVERRVVTRYYTEFDPNPDTVLNRLFGDAGDGLPPVFYEIEELNGSDYKIPSRVGIKPLSINVQAGNWGDQISWVAQWEDMNEAQAPLKILGLTLYDWTKSVASGEEVAEYLFGHKIFGTSDNSAGDFTRLRQKKNVYNYRGIVPGEIDYRRVKSLIDLNTSVVKFTYSYQPIQNITQVNIAMEEDESEDDNNG